MRASEYRGTVGGVQMFAMSGPDAASEAVRYAYQYAEEGAVTLQRRIQGKWKTVAAWERRKPAKQGEAG